MTTTPSPRDSHTHTTPNAPKLNPKPRTYGPRPAAEFFVVQPTAERAGLPQVRYGLPAYVAKLQLLGSAILSYTHASTMVMLLDNKENQDELNTQLADVHGIMKATGIRGSGTGGEFYTLPRRLGRMFTCSPTPVHVVSGQYATQSLAELLSAPLPTMGPATLTMNETPELGPRIGVLSVGSSQIAGSLVRLLRSTYKPHTIFSSHAPDDSDSLEFTILVELSQEEIDEIAPDLRRDPSYVKSVKMQADWVEAERAAAEADAKARAEAARLATERDARIRAMIADAEAQDEDEAPPEVA